MTERPRRNQRPQRILASERVGQVFVETVRGRDRIEFTEYGAGDAWVVLVAPLLMPRSVHDRLARALAAAGLHVLVPDLLGHGRSDRPDDPWAYSVPAFAEQVVALLDEAGAAQAVVAGTGIGANVALEVSVAAPDRVRGLVLDGPVLDDALAGELALLGPVMYLARFAPLGVDVTRRATRLVPRRLVPGPLARPWGALDQRSGPLAALVHGVLFGRLAPSARQRREIGCPALVIARRHDPLRPASDARTLAEEIGGAQLEETVERAEWRRTPERLDLLVTRFALDCSRARRVRRARRTSG